jgi:NADP-dependent 3-hydroxy acid dehydrogenase YdfG
MKVVLADIQEDALEEAADRLGERGTVMAVPTDVSTPASVEDLAREAQAIGQVRIVCNNAGVAGVSASPGWAKSAREWRWVLEVNLWGVINGVRAFMPEMVERDEGTIINTASVAGLIPFPFGAPYAASKHAVVGISLSIRQELEMLGSRVRISVLCPGWVRTNVATSKRNWLDRLGGIPEVDDNEMSQMLRAMTQSLVDGGMEPSEVAAHVFDAVQEDRFWILPNADQFAPAIRGIADSAIERRNPPTVQPG